MHISCIIPVFNGARFIGQAIASVAEQSVPDIEIIVVDDGSTDDTASVVLSGRWRVRYERQVQKGPASARNAGLALASGEMISFLDADDWWHPEKTARQLAYLDEHPEAGGAVAQAVSVHDAASPIVSERRPPSGTVAPAYVTSALLARRTTFDRVGGFNPALTHSDDTDWFLRARAAGLAIDLVPLPLVFRRLHDQNLSLQRRPDSVDEYLRLLRNKLARERAPRAGYSA